MLSRHSAGTYSGNELKRNSSGNTCPQSPQLAGHRKIVFAIHCSDDVEIAAQVELGLINLQQNERAASHRRVERDVLKNWSHDREPWQESYAKVISAPRRNSDVWISALESGIFEGSVIAI